MLIHNKLYFAFYLLLSNYLLFVSTESITTSFHPRCFWPKASGNCRGYFIRYYYDLEEKICKKYVYGGCGVKVPFRSLEQCNKICIDKDLSIAMELPVEFEVSKKFIFKQPFALRERNRLYEQYQ
ncbi:hypothetical protein K502DRAFT_351714 [Neoconidiobolus thromboides FSU 785]|nr:hypothetical protein K502DRAFT_351714 [Neoconidiobolus thromboides FSU 785]